MCLPIKLNVGAREGAVARNIGTENVFDQSRRITRNRIPQTQCRPLGPSPRTYPWNSILVELNVERQTDALRSMTIEPLDDLIGSLNGGTAYNDPADALSQ